MAGKKLLVNQSKAMPCFVHPVSDQLHVVPTGASSNWKLLRDRVVFPFTITWGGMVPPAALIAAIIVIVSRFPLVLACKYLLPFVAITLPGLWSSCSPVSSIFQIKWDLSHSSFSFKTDFTVSKYFSILNFFQVDAM